MEKDKKIPEWALAQLEEQEFLKSQMTVTLVDYQSAISQLVAVAQQDTSAAATSAQVLLSIYNGRNWQLDITDLGSLDYNNLSAALIAIRGWLFVQEYPHNVIENGTAIFDDLEAQWQHLHVDNRYKKHYEKD